MQDASYNMYHLTLPASSHACKQKCCPESPVLKHGPHMLLWQPYRLTDAASQAHGIYM